MVDNFVNDTLNDGNGLKDGEGNSGRKGDISRLFHDVIDSPRDEIESTTASAENPEMAAEMYKEEWNRRAEERKLFRHKNLNVSREEFEKRIRGKKLDSNLKKCTAFIRKLKQFVESQKTSIVSDLNSLNLSKYQSEMATVIVEGKFKPAEIPAMLNVCSELHQRYSEFSELLLENFKKILPTKKSEMTPANISKMSSDIRMFTELFLAGIIPQQEGYQVLTSSLKTMVFLDKDGSQFVVPFTSLLKGLVNDLLGLIPKEKRLQNVASQLIRSDSLTNDKKAELHKILKDYFSTVSNSVEKKHEELLRSERHNRKLLVTKGEVPTDRLDSHNELKTKFDKYHSSVVKFSILIDVEMPALKELPPEPEDELEKALLTTEDGEVLTEVPGIVLFDNEENRQFYQDYPDLKVYLPPVVYRDTIVQMQEQTKRIEEMEKSLNEFDEEAEQAELQDEKEDANSNCETPRDLEDNEEDKEDGKDVGAVTRPPVQAFSTYLDNLPNLVNRNMIDKAAIEFAECFNNKRHRRELVRRMFIVPRQRVDLLPLYARLTAILSRVFPDIGIDLSNILSKDFRYLIIKKDQIKLETKLKVTRFIGELVNFHIFPKSEAFNCLKLMLRNFTHHQIEMACVFLETCGRLLYRSTDSHRRMRIYLEEILRRKTVRKLEPRYVYMVDSAYSFVCPPATGNQVRKKKLPLDAFMECVLWEDLRKSTLERANNVLRMYDWTDPKKYLLVVKILSSPWKFNYVQMEAAAALLASIKKFRPSVTIAVVENLTEQVRVGCDYEFDDFNCHRMAASQYIAYIYTYRGLSSTTLFNIWYYLISYGVTYRDDFFTSMDPQDSLHRIRMVCQMLRVCGEYLSSSTSSRHRLNCFLKYFQRYYVYKRNLPCWRTTEFPFSVEEFYEDTFKRIRSRWIFAQTMEEAEKDIAEMDEQLRNKVKNNEIKTAIQIPNTKCVQVPKVVSKNLKRSRHKPAPKMQAPSLDKIAEEPQTEEEQLAAEFKTVHIKDPYELYDEDVDDHKDIEDGIVDDSDFLAAFEQMCMEANQTVLTPRSMNTDIPVPMSIQSRKPGSEPTDGVVKVTVMTKKNNRQKLKCVEVPANEEFLVSLRSREEAEQQEKQNMKKRTLAITRLQEEEERREQQEAVSQLVFSTAPRPKMPYKY